MFDWNFGYGQPGWNVRVGGGYSQFPQYGQFPNQPVFVPQQNNQILWLVLIIGAAVVLLKD
jgi:hypothetical protein